MDIRRDLNSIESCMDMISIMKWVVHCCTICGLGTFNDSMIITNLILGAHKYQKETTAKDVVNLSILLDRDLDEDRAARSTKMTDIGVIPSETLI
jgi:hypothetical protein